MYLPSEIYSKITLYNSTVLCDLFKSRLKINSLMTLFKLNSGIYIYVSCITWSQYMVINGVSTLKNKVL